MKESIFQETKELKLWMLFTRTNYLIRKIRQRELDENGLRLHSSAVIASIAKRGKKATIATIQKETMLEAHTISEHLKRLEKQGLIRKIRSEYGRAIKRIELTGEGEKAMSVISKGDIVKSIISELTDEEQEQMGYFMDKLQSRAVKILGFEEMLNAPEDAEA